jgi:ATP-dependent Clp protease ATP-binding subunit ClpC
MPQVLREQETELNRLRREEEEAGARRDYERAATLRARYLALDQEFSAARDIWLKNSNLDEVVDEEDVAAIVSNWTGVPVNRTRSGARAAA